MRLSVYVLALAVAVVNVVDGFRPWLTPAAGHKGLFAVARGGKPSPRPQSGARPSRPPRTLTGGVELSGGGQKRGGSNNKVRDDADDEAETLPSNAYAKDSKLSDEERLQKVIARAGLASRRGAEALILDGRVVVNGKAISELGVKVNAKKDIILVDGKKLSLPDAKGTFWVMINKPKAVLTTMDDDKKDKERRTLVDLVPKAKELRLVPVGSMERDSTGLMLLTNDIAWIHPLTHHSYVQARRYEVVVQGFPEEASLDVLRKGCVLPPNNEACRPCQLNIIDVDNTGGLVLLDLLIEESRPQQVQRMMELIKCPLVSIKRTGFGPLGLKGLRRGQWKELTSAEIDNLKASCRKASAPVAAPGAPPAAEKQSLGSVLRKRRTSRRKEQKPGAGYAARTEHLRAQGSKVDGADSRGSSPRSKRPRPAGGAPAARVWGGK